MLWLSGLLWAIATEGGRVCALHKECMRRAECQACEMLLSKQVDFEAEVGWTLKLTQPCCSSAQAASALCIRGKVELERRNQKAHDSAASMAVAPPGA